MTGAAIACMVVVLGIVVGGFAGFLALAMRHEARRAREEDANDAAG